MSLPKPIRPEYSTTIPSSGKRIKYQPFSVKEEKVLVLAAEGNDTDEVTNAITNVLNSCITSPTDFDMSSLALFDIEYLFLKARSKSAGEKITIKVTDPNDETFSTEHEINIDKISVTKNEDHSDLIELSDTVTVKMRYPDISFFNEGINVDNISSTVELISKCIKQIIIQNNPDEEEEIYNESDITPKEIEDWLDGLTTEQFGKISKFFETMPKLSHTFTVKNTNNGEDFIVVLEGLADFF